MEIFELNVGLMVYLIGKIMVNNVFLMDKDDVVVFEKLCDLGVLFDVCKVLNDVKKNLFDLINKVNVK